MARNGRTGSIPVRGTRIALSDIWEGYFIHTFTVFCTKYMNILLTILGLISLGLGILGIFLPVLPTTPLLLLAAFLFMRSNRKLYDWLMNHPRLGPYITDFMVHKSIPLHVKIVSISLIWLTLLNCAVFITDRWILRVMYIAIAAAVTIHISSYKTKN